MSKNKNDKQIVEQLADEKYESWIKKVRKKIHAPNSPFSFKNGTWTVNERKQMWQELGPRLFDDQLESFKQIAVRVLTEPNPAFELNPDQRYAASMYGKELEYSGSLRKGLAESLALMGSFPDALENCSRGKAEATAILAIREIFKDSDWILWGSLDNLLPTLAEASPDEFLDAIETALKKTPCPFDELFSQEDTGVTGRNYMTGLLWALETLAWDEEYIVQVTILLGKLAVHDPGGNWGNRPDNSLTSIFLPWYPQTTASVKKRIVAVKTLQKHCPVIAWKVLLSLLPDRHTSSGGTSKPEWRQTIPEDFEKEVTNKDYWEQISFYADSSVEMAIGDIDKLLELISDLHHLTKPSFEKLLDYLKSKEITDSSEENRTSLWAELKKVIIKHRKYSDADWTLNPEFVNQIEEVAENLIPQKPKYLYIRLFDEDSMDLFEEKGDWQEQEKELGNHRLEAMRVIIADGGLEAVLQFAETVNSPQEVGSSLGAATDDMDLDILPDMLETDNPKIDILVKGYIWSRRCIKGWEWIEQLKISDWSSRQIANFLTCLPFAEEAWKYAEKLLKDESEYWSEANVNPFQAKSNLDEAIGKLIKFKRPNAAIGCMYRQLHDKKPLDKAMAIDALLKAVSSDEPAYSMRAHNAVEVIESLQNDPATNQNDLLSIEWAYLQLLTGPGKTASPKLLEKKLASEPDFFCEVLRLQYRSKKEAKPEKESSEQQKAIAGNAWRLLREWKVIPGMQLDGPFSADKFNSWFEAVKTSCKESGHIEVALLTLGNVLIHSPQDPDGLWIHRAIAEALDAEDTEKMRHGFEIGIFNSRGVHHVDPTGKPEKDLAANYRQKAEEVEDATYSRFAITLRNIVKSYDRQAEQIIEEHGD